MRPKDHTPAASEASPFGPPATGRATTRPPTATSGEAAAPFRPVAPPHGAVLPPAERRPPPDFSIAMVNIVLLLVLFFLVAGTLMAEEEGRVALPETRDLPLEALPRPLLLVGEDGTLALDGETIEAGALRAAVAEIERLHLLVPRDLPANSLVEIAGEVASGGAAVSLVTVRHVVPDRGAGP